jgi:CMP-N-acetylneuraminic acid synthetase
MNRETSNGFQWLNERRVVAIVPARSQSKRVPGKNTRLLGGKPLICWSIEAGLNAETVDRVIVSTDCPEIAEIAREAGAEAPFLRPAEYAQDSSSDTPFMAHAAQWLEEHEELYVDALVLLRPTSPFRPEGLVDRCVRRLFDSGADSVRSMVPVNYWHPYWMVRLDGDRTKPFIAGKTSSNYYQTQLLPPLYTHDAYCDVTRRRNLPRNCPPNATLEGFYGRDCRAEISNEGQVINIDSEDDFRLAEAVLAAGLAPVSGSQPHQGKEMTRTQDAREAMHATALQSDLP